jgi:hypothetical protein
MLGRSNLAAATAERKAGDLPLEGRVSGVLRLEV